VHATAAGSGKYVCVYNKTRERSVATHAKVADGFFSRLVGLLGTNRLWVRTGNGLWIVPSHGVHTIGMLYALDLIFLDRYHAVVSVEEQVRPYRISKVSFQAHSVLELPIHTVSSTDTRVGDQLEISRVRADDPEVSAQI
jgi:hypothetical protein